MSTLGHDQERLSAYLDAELSAAERAEVEAHVGGCESCRANLNALRATVTEMRSLGEPVPSEQDSWALRAAIARERRGQSRRARLPVAIGGVAAAIIAFAAFTMRGPTENSGLESAKLALGATPPILLQDQNYDATSARSLLAGGSARLLGGSEADSAGTTGAPAPAQALPVSPDSGSASTTRGTGGDNAEGDTGRIPKCEKAIFPEGVPQAVSYIAARFDGRAAYLLIYALPDPARLELWVVAQNSCEVLFFAQREN